MLPLPLLTTCSYGLYFDLYRVHIELVQADVDRTGVYVRGGCYVGGSVSNGRSETFGDSRFGPAKHSATTIS